MCDISCTSEADSDLYLVTVLEEFDAVLYLDVEVVGVDVQGHLDLLDLSLLLVLPGFLLPLGLLKTVFAEIHDAAYRRSRCRSDEYEIEICFDRLIECVSRSHNAELLAVSADYSYFLLADILVDELFFRADIKAPPF